LPRATTECVPRWATARSPERQTLGRAAARVAKVLGHALMPWQRQVADVALEVNADGRLVYRDVVLSVPRQQGKSYLILVVMLTRALLQSRQVIAYAAQSGLDARKRLIEDWTPMLNAGPLGSQVKTYMAPGRESLTLSNGSQIALLSSTPKSGHGRVLDLGVMDEAFAYADARAEQALRPATMTRADPQLWVVSTAGTPDASPYLLDRVERGRLAVEADLREGIAHFEWAAADDAPLDDPATWRSCMPALGHTVTEAAVAAAQKSMARSEFARAYANRWVASMADPIIPLEDWEALAEPDAPKPARIILGLDCSPKGKSAAICAVGPAENGKLLGSVLEHGPGVDWVAAALERLQGELGRPEIVLDERACASILPEIDAMRLVPVDAAAMGEASAFLLDLATRKRLAHRGEPELVVALDGAGTRPIGDGAWAWSRRSSATDISPLVAFSLSCWGWRWSWSPE
jgi:phage terminase large subunit-like protein